MRPNRPKTTARAAKSGGARGAPYWPWLLTLLFFAASIWRLAYQARLADTPLLADLHADARVYWDWAGRIVQLGPIGSSPFFLGPLYPYVLALLRVVFGDSVRAIVTLQAVWDSAAILLLADAARRISRPWIGFALGAFLVFYPMSVFMSGLVLMESLLFLLESFLLWLVIAHSRWNRSLAGYAGIGLLIGLLSLGRASHLVLLAPALLLLAHRARREWLRPTLVLLAVTFATIAPATLHNAIVGREWIPISYNGGFNLYVGNNSHATGGWVPTTAPPQLDRPEENEAGQSLDGRQDLESRLGHSFTPAQSSREWAALAGQFAQSDPMRCARLVVRKAGMLWNWREYPQVENGEVARRLAGPLGWPGSGPFALLGALAIAGAFYAYRAGVAARFALGYVLAITVSTLPFFVTDRFRIHLVPGSVLLAALALERAWVTARGPAPRSLIRLAAALGCGVALVSLPAPHFSSDRARWGVAAEIGTLWLRNNRPDLGLPYLEEAARFEALDARAVRSTVNTSRERAQLHFYLGLALLAVGRKEEARPWLERAHAEMPDNPKVAHALEQTR